MQPLNEGSHRERGLRGRNDVFSNQFERRITRSKATLVATSSVRRASALSFYEGSFPSHVKRPI